MVYGAVLFQVRNERVRAGMARDQADQLQADMIALQASVSNSAAEVSQYS
mgnify:CR=1 FL=1